MNAGRGTCRRAVALATAALIAVVPNVGGILHAADDAGIHAFFAAEANRAAPLSKPAPATRSLPGPFTRTSLPLAPRELAPRRLPTATAVRVPPNARTRFASLPGAGKTAKAPKPRAESDQPGDHRRATKPVAQAAISDPVAALLQDKTLRAGDIVVLLEGPKVFRGDEGRISHKWSSFESVETSRLLPKTTRKMVLALARPVVSASRESAAYLPASAAEMPAAGQQARANLIRVVHPR